MSFATREAARVAAQIGRRIKGEPSRAHEWIMEQMELQTVGAACLEDVAIVVTTGGPGVRVTGDGRVHVRWGFSESATRSLPRESRSALRAAVREVLGGAL